MRCLTRRRFLSLAAASAAAGSVGLGGARAARVADISLVVPYFPQGGSGDQAPVNCGPAAIASMVAYSGVSFPTVKDVRATLGLSGPTDMDQWAWLLDAYGVPWFPTQTQAAFDEAIRAGNVLLVAAWMGGFGAAPDFEQPYSASRSAAGRYSSYGLGHAMVVVGMADAGTNYLVHDPNVFPNVGTTFYGNGAPKGSYRRYPAAELWGTVQRYADGPAFAVAPVRAGAPAPPSTRHVRPEEGGLVRGPGGGHPPERGERGVTGVTEVTPDEPGQGPRPREIVSAVSEDGAS